MKPSPVPSSQLSREEACMEVARSSFLALFESGRHINRLSTGTLAFTALTAIVIITFKPIYLGPSHPLSSEWILSGLMAISFLFGIIQQYAAIRVAIDLQIFRDLSEQSQRWRTEANPEGLGSWKNSAVEEILAEAIHAIKRATPSVLAKQPDDSSTGADYLDPYRRTARLYYKQVAYALCQLLAYTGVIVYLLLPPQP